MKKQPSLIFCIVMDVLGCLTYIVPGLGEIADVIWAPISAFVFYRAFGGGKAAFGALFNFAEEIIPGTDFIPTFTIAWIWQYVASRKTNTATVCN